MNFDGVAMISNACHQPPSDIEFQDAPTSPSPCVVPLLATGVVCELERIQQLVTNPSTFAERRPD